MGSNVNTIPSNEEVGYSINWLSFQSSERSIDAKKLVNSGKGRVPNCSKADVTFIINRDNEWERCHKVDDKLKIMKGAAVTNETKKSRFAQRLEKKYAKQDKEQNNR